MHRSGNAHYRGRLHRAECDRPTRIDVTYRSEKWSGRLDSNQRPPAPKAGALPGCATPRLSSSLSIPPARVTRDRSGRHKRLLGATPCCTSFHPSGDQPTSRWNNRLEEPPGDTIPAHAFLVVHDPYSIDGKRGDVVVAGTRSVSVPRYDSTNQGTPPKDTITNAWRSEAPDASSFNRTSCRSWARRNSPIHCGNSFPVGSTAPPYPVIPR